MMNKLRDFLIGRYCRNDELNLALVLLGCVLTLILSFVENRYLHFISWIPFIIMLVRFLSKNIAKRQAENGKFLSLIEPWKKFLVKKTGQMKDKEHKYYNCPGCSRTLRVPKNRGKIKISCPHCGREFTKRT
ncbi:MAG: hypothetical protein IJ491_00050 [Clostridia bacterium]|nr:hypothetical protein [Clostridia bacterium]